MFLLRRGIIIAKRTTGVHIPVIYLSQNATQHRSFFGWLNKEKTIVKNTAPKKPEDKIQFENMVTYKPVKKYTDSYAYIRVKMKGNLQTSLDETLLLAIRKCSEKKWLYNEFKDVIRALDLIMRTPQMCSDIALRFNDLVIEDEEKVYLHIVNQNNQSNNAAVIHLDQFLINVLKCRNLN